MKLACSLFALPFLFACQSGPHEPVETPANLTEVLGQYGSLTGINLTYDEQTAQLLSSMAVEPVGPAEANVLRIASPQLTTNVATAEGVFEVIPLEFAFAPEVAQVLTKLVADASAGADKPKIKILTDERTNSLLVMAPEAHMTKVKELIAQLDVKAGG